MYYVINDIDNPSMDEDEDDAPFLEIHEELLTNPKRGWHSGFIIADPPTNPIRIEATPHFGYVGPPPDYYDDSVSLMSPRLKTVLDKVGVDNIDYYPAVITYRESEEIFEWYAFNIIGLVEAVDVAKSDIKNEDGALLTNSTLKGFAVDDSKVYPLKVFRLAENVMTTLVSENVKNAIEDAGINTFAFTDPKDWIVI